MAYHYYDPNIHGRKMNGWNLRIHPLEEENHLPNHHFQVLCYSAGVFFPYIRQITAVLVTAQLKLRLLVNMP